MTPAGPLRLPVGVQEQPLGGLEGATQGSITGAARRQVLELPEGRACMILKAG